MLTNKEIFNKVRKHLLTQRAQSFLEDNQTCAYRSPKGLKCAVGCLISDEDYSTDMEVTIVPYCYKEYVGDAKGTILLKKVLSKYIPEKSLPFLEELQSIHDQYSPEEWPSALIKLKRKYAI
jgi:hypothetical protein